MTDEALQAELLANQSQEIPEMEDLDVALDEGAESSEEPQSEENSTIDAPLGQLFGEKIDEPKQTDNNKTVPLSTFLDLKSEMKELKESLKVGQGNQALEELAQEYDVDVDFMRKLANTIQQENAKEIQAKYDPIIKKQEEETRLKEQNNLFDKVFEQAKKSYTDISDVINKEIIKDMALNPKNANKTVKELIKEVYGGVMNKTDESPAPSFEKVQARASKESGLDFGNLSLEDHNAIAADPKLKKAYGDWVVKNIL